MTLIPRAVPLTTFTAPDPAIVNGKPILPTWWQKSDSSVTATEGTGHIVSIADPNPVIATDYSWIYPPPPTPSATSAQFFRWTVDDLPDPSGFTNGFYWLGDPSPYDGTSGITSAAQQWKCNNHPSAPTWRSFYPFKPSVVPVNHYLFGGETVNHPKGVSFNAHFIEHMWMDWGSDHPQPFTWVICAMMTNWPSGYIHRVLDAGRNPDDVGFPRLQASDTGTPRTIADGLSYRNAMYISAQHQVTLTNSDPAKQVIVANDVHLRPKMYFGVYNGSSSYTGAYDPGIKRINKGAIATGGAHRYYVLGRKQGLIRQDFACHMLVFELRYWSVALTKTEIYDQYVQLASTYQFASYYR